MAWQYLLYIFTLLAVLLRVNNQRIEDQYHIGPQNITRAVGENNVYIPCSTKITSPKNPIWKINNTFYDVYNLPDKLIPDTFGILITRIEMSMNGMTFQCIIDDELSSVGMLTVEEVSENHRSYFNTIPELVNLPQIELDYYQEFQVHNCFAANLSDCINFEMNLTTCNGTIINTWIGSEIHNVSFRDERPISFQPFFKVNAFDIDRDICLELLPYFTTDKASESIRTDFKLSYNEQLCVTLPLESTTYLVLIRGEYASSEKECNCYAIFGTSYYVISRCYCYCTRNNASIAPLILQPMPEGGVVQACFNTSDMNNTILHTFENFRYCNSESNLMSSSSQSIKPFRIFSRIQKISIVLPTKPNVSIDRTSKTVHFVSRIIDGISLDYYQIIITDITNLTIYNDTIPKNVSNFINISDLFSLAICSPYYVTVQAHNHFGYKESSISLKTANGSGDECQCIKHKDIINTEYITFEQGRCWSIQISCPQASLDSMLQVIAMLNGSIVTNASDECSSMKFNQSMIYDCGPEITFLIYWISQNGQGCLVKNESRTQDCKEHGRTEYRRPWIFFGIGIIVLAVFFIVLVICCIVAYIYTKVQKYNVITWILRY